MAQLVGRCWKLIFLAGFGMNVLRHHKHRWMKPWFSTPRPVIFKTNPKKDIHRKPSWAKGCFPCFFSCLFLSSFDVDWFFVVFSFLNQTFFVNCSLPKTCSYLLGSVNWKYREWDSSRHTELYPGLGVFLAKMPSSRPGLIFTSWAS